MRTDDEPRETVQQHIVLGQQLKQAMLDMASSWKVDSKTETFPAFITGETHNFGELEHDIRRWFNQAEQLTRDILTHHEDRETLRWALYYLPKPPEKDSTRSEYLESIGNHFDKAIGVLKTIPSRYGQR